MLLQEHTGACYSPPHSASERPYSEKSALPPRIALAVLNVSHVTHQHKRTMPRLNNNTPLSLPNIPQQYTSRDNTALEAVWCQLSAQDSALGEPKELILSKGYDKILLSIQPGMLPPTAQPWLRKSNTSEKCLHANYTLLPASLVGIQAALQPASANKHH